MLGGFPVLLVYIYIYIQLYCTIVISSELTVVSLQIGWFPSTYVEEEGVQ